jgi:hypothetical protein
MNRPKGLPSVMATTNATPAVQQDPCAVLVLPGLLQRAQEEGQGQGTGMRLPCLPLSDSLCSFMWRAPCGRVHHSHPSLGAATTENAWSCGLAHLPRGTVRSPFLRARPSPCACTRRVVCSLSPPLSLSLSLSHKGDRGRRAQLACVLRSAFVLPFRGERGQHQGPLPLSALTSSSSSSSSSSSHLLLIVLTLVMMLRGTVCGQQGIACAQRARGVLHLLAESLPRQLLRPLQVQGRNRHNARG